MKRHLFIVLNFGILLILGCAAQVTRTSATPAAQTSPSMPEPTAEVKSDVKSDAMKSEPKEPKPKEASTPSAATASSPFIEMPQSGHPQIQGNAQIVTENGTRYIVFDENFKTDNAPDLTVVLTRDRKLNEAGLEEGTYTLVSELNANSGSQRYAIPSEIDVAQYGAIAIWCRQFNVTFGYVPLP
jgi:Electron transfer DM13